MNNVHGRVATLKGILQNCVLCPRRCRVDRTRGETGFCRLGAAAVIDCALAHHGEEPPLSGAGGAGTIFFSSCNLKCVYCQNYQISHNIRGKSLDKASLAEIMLALQADGCQNIEPVTPTPQTPQIMEALLQARERGLKVPFVYNCGGYEAPEVIRMLAGMVDIYLPDFKYGKEDEGLLFSGAQNYPSYALASIKEMIRQVGDELELEGNIAKKGILIRHLVLPGSLANSFAVLRMIREKLSTRIPLSIMAQYSPIPAIWKDPVLGRRINHAEYEAVINFALDMDFETIFTQEVDDHSLLPDFENDAPFTW